MAELDQALQDLQALLAQHESVQAFQEVAAKLEQHPELKRLAHEMKAYQQESVLFEKIDKQRAADQSAKQADQLEKELSELPLVQDYRRKMQDASDLLHYVTQSLEEKINEELGNGKR